MLPEHNNQNSGTFLNTANIKQTLMHNKNFLGKHFNFPLQAFDRYLYIQSQRQDIKSS